MRISNESNQYISRQKLTKNWTEKKKKNFQYQINDKTNKSTDL